MPAKIEFKTGKGELPVITIDTPWSEGEVYLHGGHVTRFQKKGETHPILWMSKSSRYEAASPIRGGIPVIFPWFGGREGKAAHGFARVSEWVLKQIETDISGAVTLLLELPNASQNTEFSQFKFEQRITFAASLEVELRTTNESATAPFVFEQCLHTYFTVGDIAAATVAGLQGVGYLDKVGGTTERVEANECIVVTSEVDRVYQDTAHTVEIRDRALGRTIIVEKEGALSTIVWNPWIAKSKAMADFGDEEYLGMICVESGSVGKNKIELPPQGVSSMKVRLSSKAVA